MKKLTALLLGTVIGIAFTASDALAENPVMKYLKSDDGRTGGYLGVAYTHGGIDDVKASYLTGDDGGSKSTWKLDGGRGARAQFGFDFGKVRFDWRLAAVHSRVSAIDGSLDPNHGNEAVLGYSTFNFALDLYRFNLLKQNFVELSLTPYVGAGVGYGGALMTGKKLGNRQGTDPAGHGSAWTWEAGVLLNVFDFAGITAGYNYLNMELNGHGTVTGSTVESHFGSVGVRFTY